MTGKLYLIPTQLSEEALHVIPQYVHAITQQLRVFIVEQEKTARRYLRKTGYTASFDETTLLLLNEHTEADAISGYIDYLKRGIDCGLMSEAGVPAVADPGSAIVHLCHLNHIQVVPLVGPSSILLSLMGSGFNGQQFHFNGYIPVKQPLRKEAIQKMDNEARKNITQLFIETPYRNNSLLQELVAVCHNDTKLCIASDLTGTKERIQTQTIFQWRKNLPKLDKIPAIFLLGR